MVCALFVLYISVVIIIYLAVIVGWQIKTSFFLFLLIFDIFWHLNNLLICIVRVVILILFPIFFLLQIRRRFLWLFLDFGGTFFFLLLRRFALPNIVVVIHVNRFCFDYRRNVFGFLRSGRHLASLFGLLLIVLIDQFRGQICIAGSLLG